MNLPELAAEIVSVLRARGQTVATAESLTGGLLGATLTEVPGASTVYRGGLIPYATELKATLAGVSSSTLAADGPVAATTAAQLAAGTARTCAADWGLATTGVAGPEPQDGHPVGQVFVAVAGAPLASDPEPADGFRAGSSPHEVSSLVEPAEVPVEVRELRLTGDRDAIRRQTVAAVLGLLLESLSES